MAGSYSLSKFQKMARPKTAGERNEQLMMDKARKQLERTSDPVEKLRCLCLSRGANGILGLGRMFRRMDDDHSKQLGYEEFRKGVHDTGLELGEEECRTMFSMFDKDASGQVSIDEFLYSVRPPMNRSRQGVVMEAYQKLDKSGDGVITIEDLRGVYDVKNHPKYLNGEATEEQLYTKFLQNFETSGLEGKNTKQSVGDGKITKDEFMDYYSGISASIDLDSYFDLMVRTAWKL